MGKFIFVLSSVLVVLAFLNFGAVVAHPRAHPNFQHMEECKTAEEATNEDMKSMRNPNVPMTKAAKCVLTCIGEKSGKIVNNKLDPAGVTNWFKNSPDYTAEMGKTLTEVVEVCKTVQDQDRCENGYKIMECMKDEAVKRGMKFPFKGGPPKN